MYAEKCRFINRSTLGKHNCHTTTFATFAAFNYKNRQYGQSCRFLTDGSHGLILSVDSAHRLNRINIMLITFCLQGTLHLNNECPLPTSAASSRQGVRRHIPGTPSLDVHPRQPPTSRPTSLHRAHACTCVWAGWWLWGVCMGGGGAGMTLRCLVLPGHAHVVGGGLGKVYVFKHRPLNQSWRLSRLSQPQPSLSCHRRLLKTAVWQGRQVGQQDVVVEAPGQAGGTTGCSSRGARAGRWDNMMQ